MRLNVLTALDIVIIESDFCRPWELWVKRRLGIRIEIGTATYIVAQRSSPCRQLGGMRSFPFSNLYDSFWAGSGMSALGGHEAQSRPSIDPFSLFDD